MAPRTSCFRSNPIPPSVFPSTSRCRSSGMHHGPENLLLQLLSPPPPNTPPSRSPQLLLLLTDKTRVLLLVRLVQVGLPILGVVENMSELRVPASDLKFFQNPEGGASSAEPEDVTAKVGGELHYSTHTP